MKTKPALSMETFRKENRVNAGVCNLTTFLKSLPPSEVAVVKTVILDPTIQATAIARTLKKERAFPYTYQVISRHRSRGCHAADCALRASKGTHHV